MAPRRHLLQSELDSTGIHWTSSAAINGEVTTAEEAAVNWGPRALSHGGVVETTFNSGIWGKWRDKVVKVREVDKNLWNPTCPIKPADSFVHLPAREYICGQIRLMLFFFIWVSNGQRILSFWLGGYPPARPSNKKKISHYSLIRPARPSNNTYI